MSSNIIDIRETIPHHPTKKWKTRVAVNKIVVHTTASPNQDPNKTAMYHIQSDALSKGGAPSIAYHDFITKTGVVYHCNAYNDWTWHAGLYNKDSVGIALAYEGQTGETPVLSQMEALLKHLTLLSLYMKIVPSNIIGHREIPGMYTILGNGSKKYKKVCPGLGLNLDHLRLEVCCRVQMKLKEEGLYFGEIDGCFGPRSQGALKLFVPPALRELIVDRIKYQ